MFLRKAAPRVVKGFEGLRSQGVWGLLNANVLIYIQQIGKDAFIRLKPSVIYSLSGSGASLRRGREHPQQQVFGLVGHVRNVLVNMVDLANAVLLEHLAWGVPTKYISIRQEIIKHWSQAKDVYFVTIASLSKNFWSAITGSAAHIL